MKKNNLISKTLRFLHNQKQRVRLFDVFYGLKYIFFRIKYYSLIIRNNTTDRHVFIEIFVKNELNIMINQPNFIIDCGAYVGYSTFYFSKKYPRSTIVAIEPEISNFNILKENTKKLKNVILINKAIYYKKSKLKIIDTSEGKWAFQVLEDDNGDIDSITVEELLEKFKVTRINLLKIDIEGSEKTLFENSDNWINKVNYIAIELHDRYMKGCSDSFFHALKKGDFTIGKSGEKVIAINKNQ
jgi:FkbM family methyltransferase